MATIKPFPALRPEPALADRICELPYDVMSSEEARLLAKDNPLSFLHISKPEIDLPPGTDVYSPQVYAKGKENFERQIANGSLRQDAQPCFYLYRQIMGNHSQTGLVAVASCDEYLQGIIRRHELTRPDKEDDRVRHIEALNAQTGPAFLVYPAQPAIDQVFAQTQAATPAIDFTAADGVRHTAWVISDRAQITFIEAQFQALPRLYIADGHHRSAAAGRVCQARKGIGASASYLNVIFPHNQVKILPYNRVLSDLNGHSPAQVLEAVGRVFTVTPGGRAEPGRKHELGFYCQGKWHTCEVRAEFTGSANPIETLDVTILQTQVLAPVFGIDNPRTSKRINFVGGIRGTAELEKLVDSGEYACAFSMFPTSVQDLMTIADAGGIMPPKSTWFEPKLRDGLFSHLL